MYRVRESATVATVTELRRNTAALMKEADEGTLVLIQKDNEPRGVYLSFERYEHLELAEIAVARMGAIERGEMGTTSLDDMIAEFAPQLRRDDTDGG